MSDDPIASTSKESEPQEPEVAGVCCSLSECDAQESPGKLTLVEVSNPEPPAQTFKDKRRVSIQGAEDPAIKNDQLKEDPDKPSLATLQHRYPSLLDIKNCPHCYVGRNIKSCGISCISNRTSPPPMMAAEPDPLGLETLKPNIDVKFCIAPGFRQRRGARGECPAFASSESRRPVTAPPAFHSPMGATPTREEDARALAPFLTRSEQQLLARLENPPQIQSAASNTSWDLGALAADSRWRALLAASGVGEGVARTGVAGQGVTGAAAFAKATGLRGLCHCGPPAAPEDPFYRDARGLLARTLRETARKRMVCVPMEIECGGTSTLKIDPPGTTNWDWLIQTQRSCPLLPPQGLQHSTGPTPPADINIALTNQQSMGNRVQFQPPRPPMDPLLANFYRGTPPQFGGFQSQPFGNNSPQYNQQNPQNPYYQPQTQTFGTQTQTTSSYPPPQPPSGAYGQQTYGQQTQSVYPQPGMQNQQSLINPNTGFMSTQTPQTGYGQGLGQGGQGSVSQGIGTTMGGQGLGNFGAQGQAHGFGTHTQGIGTQGQTFGAQSQAYSGQAPQGQYLSPDSYASLFGASQPSYPPQFPPPHPGGYPNTIPPPIFGPQPFGQGQQHQQQPSPYPQPFGQTQHQQQPSPYPPQPYGQSQQPQQPAPYPQQGYNQPGGQYGTQSQYGNPFQGHQMQQSPYVNHPTTVYACAPSYPPYTSGGASCYPQLIVGVGMQPYAMHSYAAPTPSTPHSAAAAAAAAMHQHYSEVTATTQVEGGAALALLRKMTSTMPATDDLGTQKPAGASGACWCGPPDQGQLTPAASQPPPPPSAGTVTSPPLLPPPSTPANALTCPGKVGLPSGAFCSPLELTLRSCWRSAEGVVTACERTITCAPTAPSQQQRARTCGPQSLAALSLAVAVRDRRLCLWPAALGASPTPPPQPPQLKNVTCNTGTAPGPAGGDPTPPPPPPTSPTTFTAQPTTQLPPPVTLNMGPWMP